MANWQDSINRALSRGVDMTKPATSGGSEYTPPAAGKGCAIFVGYIELGKHTETFQNVASDKDKVQYVFELSGKKWPAKVLQDGTQIPQRVTITETNSLHEKSNNLKLVKKLMALDPGAAHVAQLIGQHYNAEVFHSSFVNKANKQVTIAKLRDPSGGYTFSAPTRYDPNTEEEAPYPCPKILTSNPMVFLWNDCSLDDWDNLYIDGTYGDGISKNKIQEKILAARNFAGSRLQTLLKQRDAGLNPETIEDLFEGVDGVIDNRLGSDDESNPFETV